MIIFFPRSDLVFGLINLAVQITWIHQMVLHSIRRTGVKLSTWFVSNLQYGFEDCYFNVMFVYLFYYFLDCRWGMLRVFIMLQGISIMTITYPTIILMPILPLLVGSRYSILFYSIYLCFLAVAIILPWSNA